MPFQETLGVREDQVFEDLELGLLTLIITLSRVRFTKEWEPRVE